MADTFAAPSAEYTSDGYVLRFPYDDDTKDALKSEIPVRERGWRPELEGWWVSADQFPLALDILHRTWREVAVTGEDGGDYIAHRDGTRTAQSGLFD